MEKRPQKVCLKYWAFCHLTTLRFEPFLAGMNNAKFALVIAGSLSHQYGGPDEGQWRSFLASIQKNVPPDEGTLRIRENVWQIPLDTGMPFLSKLFDWASGMRIPMHILFLDEKPDWIQYPPAA